MTVLEILIEARDFQRLHGVNRNGHYKNAAGEVCMMGALRTVADNNFGALTGPAITARQILLDVLPDRACSSILHYNDEVASDEEIFATWNRAIFLAGGIPADATV